MSEFEPRMCFFDVAAGELIVGAAAYEDRLESGAHPLDLIDLPTLLTTEEPLSSHFTENIEMMRWQDWDKDLDVPYAQWLHSCSLRGNDPRPLTREMIIRASHLGIGPPNSYFNKIRPGRLTGLYAEAGLEGVKTRGLFDHWTKSDFVEYYTNLAERLGRRPTQEDIDEAAHIAGNPGNMHIYGHGYSLAVLAEHSGWVTVRNWDHQDFIDWGVRFMIANDGRYPKSPDLELLAKQGFGPHSTAIFKGNEFRSFLDFQTQVMEAYDDYRVQEETKNKNTLEDIYEIESRNELFASLIAPARERGDEDAIIRIYARFKILDIILPQSFPDFITKACKTKRSRVFVDFVLEHNPSINAGIIENAAVWLDVFDYLWPMDEYKQRLRVT